MGRHRIQVQGQQCRCPKSLSGVGANFGAVAADILPAKDSDQAVTRTKIGYNLGSYSKAWKELYIDTILPPLSGGVTKIGTTSSGVQIDGAINSNLIPDANVTRNLGKFDTVVSRRRFWNNICGDKLYLQYVNEFAPIGANNVGVMYLNRSGHLLYQPPSGNPVRLDTAAGNFTPNSLPTLKPNPDSATENLGGDGNNEQWQVLYANQLQSRYQTSTSFTANNNYYIQVNSILRPRINGTLLGSTTHRWDVYATRLGSTSHIQCGGNLSVTGITTLTGRLTANNGITVPDDKTISLHGESIAEWSDISVSWNGGPVANATTFSSNVTFNGDIASNLIPSNSTRDLGSSSSSERWNNLYIKAIHGTGDFDTTGSVEGSSIVSNGTITASSTIRGSGFQLGSRTITDWSQLSGGTPDPVTPTPTPTLQNIIPVRTGIGTNLPTAANLDSWFGTVPGSIGITTWFSPETTANRAVLCVKHRSIWFRFQMEEIHGRVARSETNPTTKQRVFYHRSNGTHPSVTEIANGDTPEVAHGRLYIHEQNNDLRDGEFGYYRRNSSTSRTLEGARLNQVWITKSTSTNRNTSETRTAIPGTVALRVASVDATTATPESLNTAFGSANGSIGGSFSDTPARSRSIFIKVSGTWYSRDDFD